MAKFSTLLQQRFLKKEKPKMAELAKQSTGGQLTVFSGIFGNPQASEKEQELLADLLQKYALDPDSDCKEDLASLLAITSEVKAINNQAAILHGERIKRAQQILKHYREGAFSAWLIATYGNRQTPYNFLQYYDFFSQMPKTLHPQIEAMPRQAVYTLASREGALEKKEEVVRNYKGETKQQMMALIRSFFPLQENDGRRENVVFGAIKQLQQIATTFSHNQPRLSSKEKQTLLSLLETIQNSIVRPQKDMAKVPSASGEQDRLISGAGDSQEAISKTDSGRDDRQKCTGLARTY